MAKITIPVMTMNRSMGKPSSQGLQSTALGHQKALQPILIADVLLNTTHVQPTWKLEIK